MEQKLAAAHADAEKHKNQKPAVDEKSVEEMQKLKAECARKTELHNLAQKELAQVQSLMEEQKQVATKAKNELSQQKVEAANKLQKVVESEKQLHTKNKELLAELESL